MARRWHSFRTLRRQKPRCSRYAFVLMIFLVQCVVIFHFGWTNSEETKGREKVRAAESLSRSRARSLARQYSELSRMSGTGKVRPYSQLLRAEKQRAKERSVHYQRKVQDLENECKKNTRGKRWYITSDRKDFVGYVSQELNELGLCPANGTRHRADLYFGEQFDSVNAPSWLRLSHKVLAEDALVSSIGGLMSLFGQKDNYADLFWSCQEKPHRLCPGSAWLPSFNVYGGTDRRQRKFKTGRIDKKDIPKFDYVYHRIIKTSTNFPMFWIIKPQKGTFLARGMHISKLKKEDALTQTNFLHWISRSALDEDCYQKYDAAKCDQRQITFQLYVHKPALYYNRKFDIRLWFLITSLNPLRIFLLRHAYPKAASRAFSLEESFLDDQCRHIKMLLDPQCNTTLKQFIKPFPYTYPRSTASPIFFAGLRLPGLSSPAANTNLDILLNTVQPSHDRQRLARAWPIKEQFWNTNTWPALEATFSKLVMLLRSNLTHPGLSSNLRKEKFSWPFSSRKSRPTTTSWRPFALLSPDITLDHKGSFFVEEINANGLIMGTHARDGGAGNLFFDDGYVKALLRIIGADGYPSASKYSSKLEAAIHRFCSSTRCTVTDKEALRQAVHEEAHAGPHWYRLYPPIRCFLSTTESYDCIDLSEDTGVGYWPNQARFEAADFSAMPESRLDTIVRAFLDATDTAAIHGVPQVPGHARWSPREFDGTASI